MKTPTSLTPTPSDLIHALSAFVAQSPGLDRADYGSDKDFRAESSRINRMRIKYTELLAELAGSPLTVDAIKRAAPERLRYDASTGKWVYTAGQYWPVEYRAAAVFLVEGLLRDVKGHRYATV